MHEKSEVFTLFLLTFCFSCSFYVCFVRLLFKNKLWRFCSVYVHSGHYQHQIILTKVSRPLRFPLFKCLIISPCRLIEFCCFDTKRPQEYKLKWSLKMWKCKSYRSEVLRGEETVISQCEKEFQRQDISNAEKQVLHLDVFTHFYLEVPSVWPEFVLSGRVRLIYFSLTASWMEWDRTFFLHNFLLIAKFKLPCQTVSGSLYLFSRQSYDYHYYSSHVFQWVFCSLSSMLFFTPISKLSNLQPGIKN